MEPLFASLGKAWEGLTDNYDDEHKAFLLAFLQSSNSLAREEVARLREAPINDEGIFSAPLGDLESARLVFPSGGVQLNLRAGNLAGALYQARFEGTTPDVKVKEGIVTIRYPRRLWIGKENLTAEVTLNTVIPWSIVIRSGGSEVTAELEGLDLREMEASGAGSTFRIELPEPSGMVSVQLGGSGSEFILQRPAGVAARIQQKGWGSSVVFDNQTVSGKSNDGRLQTPDYEGAAQRYDIETSGSGSMITITTV